MQLAKVTLQDDESTTVEVLNPKSTTVETDLFNLGYATLKNARMELVVTTLLESPFPPPTEPESPASPGSPPAPNSPLARCTEVEEDEPTQPPTPPTIARAPTVAVELPPFMPIRPARAMTLLARVALARQGAGNTHPIAPPHNSLLNALIGQPLNHPPETNLPTSRADYRKLKTHLQHIERQPTRCCFNCGMLNYPGEISP